MQLETNDSIRIESIKRIILNDEKLLVIHSDRLSLFDKEGKYLYEIGKKVGSIFQDPKSQFFASITEDEISFGCENYGVPYEELDRRVSSAIKRINGDMLRGKEIYPMSSGEKQKIAVASVNAVDPEIYVFDDSFSALDMKTDRQLRQNLKESIEDATVIMVAQRISTVLDADRILVVDDGQIVGNGTHRELLDTCPLYREIAEIQLGKEAL